MNCTENKKQKLVFKNPGGRNGSFRGSTNKKCHELPRKSIPFCNAPSPPRMERERGGREGGDRAGEREREARREGGARAKPGNQLVYNNIIKKL